MASDDLNKALGILVLAVASIFLEIARRLNGKITTSADGEQSLSVVSRLDLAVVADLRNRIALNTAALEGQQRLIDEMQAQGVEKDVKILALERLVDSQGATLITVRRELEEKRIEIQTLRDENTSLQTECTKLRAQVDELLAGRDNDIP